VSQLADPQRNSASVLVIAADLDVESALKDLIETAGYRPLQDVAVGAAGESVRRFRPDVTLLDRALPPDVVLACVAATDEIRSRPALMFSTPANDDDNARLVGQLSECLDGADCLS